MAELRQIVVRYTNGAVFKGSTDDFNPNRPSFHLQLKQSTSRPVRMSDLKAVFFVKDHMGDGKYIKVRKFPAIPPKSEAGKRVAVLFRDGELLVGYTLSFTPDRQGFFMSPVDPNGNNIRIYVLNHATKNVKTGTAANQLVATLSKKTKQPKAA
jgi:hypothetical protein